MDRRNFLTASTAGLVAAGLYSPASVAMVPTALPDASLPDPAYFDELRKQFLFPSDITYGNTGTLGACPLPVMENYLGELERLERELPDWPYFQADGEPLTGYQRLDKYRARIGEFVNASSDEIALTQNATMGMSFLANGLDLAAGDEIITTDQEHSGGIGSWHLRAAREGVIVQELPLAAALDGGPDAVVEMYRQAITPKTKVLMVSQITSAFGIVMPVNDLCALARERGILSVVDGAQAIGQIPVDLQKMDCDAFVASPHKWLMAPKGTGFLYVRRDLPQRIWGTLAGSHFDDWESGAFRFMQFGTGSPAIVSGLMAAFDFVDAIGLERIVAWDQMLTNRLRDGLESTKGVTVTSPIDRRFAAAITTFRVDRQSARDLQRALWKSKIRVRAQNDENGVRFCTHIYVAPGDIDRALQIVGEIA